MELIYDTMSFLFFIVPLLVSLYNVKKYKLYESYIDARVLIGAGFIIPILEESFFRYTLYHLIGDYKYAKEIITLLFGLCHSFNYLAYRELDYAKKLTVLQIISMFSLGHYLINLNNILLSIVFHITYNVIIIWYTLMLSRGNSNIPLNDLKFKITRTKND